MSTVTKLLILLLLTAHLSACGDRTFSVSIEQAPTETADSRSLPLPPTWTPSPTSLPRPTLTPFPTFTPVPAFTAALLPVTDPFQELGSRSEQAMISPNGQWSAVLDSASMRVVNQITDKVWTLPCDLFDECSLITPVKWSADSSLLYFAPEALISESPAGIRLYTAAARIDVETGQWEKILEESSRYYDFAVSNDDAYLAYTQPAGTFADNHSVIVTIRNLKDDRDQKYTLDGFVGGNIVWSPFTTRFVFQVQDPDAGSSILYYDVNSGLLKYIIREEQSNFWIVSWGKDNLVSIRKIAWSDGTISDWILNPFTKEIAPVPTPS